MNAVNASVGLREVIGERVRALREQSGRRQVDVATAARWWGLAWPASKVAALEAGQKSISAEELLLLPGILTSALDREDDPVVIGDLLDADADVRLSSTVWAPARELPEVLAGRPAGDVLYRHTEQTAAQARRQALAVVDGVRVKERLGQLTGLGRIKSSVVLAVQEGETETEARIARQLGEPRYVLTLVYAALWGCSLSARRDALAAEQLTPDAPARTTQAKRGRITRDLISEVAAEIERRSDGKRRAKD